MVKIRLTRTGKKHQPHYRIVAVDSRKQRDGKYLEKIGYYNPRTKPPTIKYDKEVLIRWIENGAQMTDTVHDIFVREGIVEQTGKRKARIEIISSAPEKESEDSEGEEESGGEESESGDSDSQESKDAPQNNEEKDEQTEENSKKDKEADTEPEKENKESEKSDEKQEDQADKNE
jgi:small subunit ribosomal protein S16